MVRPIPSVGDSKRAADLLLKDLRSDDRETAIAAAKRFQRIQPFKAQPFDDVFAARADIQRKHALDVVSREQGYAAWKNLKDAADVLWCPRGSDVYWHNWCKTHAEAREYLDQRGGFLLPGHGTCFVAEAGFIEHLGLDPHDPRWEAIGYDICQPLDTATRDELVREREALAAK